jgi:hypothetical protein
MPNPPLLLVDNVFDTIGLYPGAVIDATSEAVGHEAFRAADYRRDRTYWQAATDGGGTHRMRVHAASGGVAVDFGLSRSRAQSRRTAPRGWSARP